MSLFSRIAFILILASFAAPSHAQQSGTPQVLVTIKPLHSLVSGLLEGITQPQLLLDGYQSPHTFQLKPSDIRKIDEAQVVIWIGPTMETALRRVLSRADKKLLIQLAENDHDHLHEDPHRWLDPTLAKDDLEKIATALIENYPNRAVRINTNLQHLSQSLDQLDTSIRERFSTTKSVSALLYHDAWGYFQERYGITADGVINPGAHSQPGTRHLYELGQTIETKHTRCLLIEPQFQPRYVDSLQSKYQLESVTLDPLGAEIPAGPGAYFTLMQHIADAFAKCL